MPLKKKDNKRELDGVIGFSVDIATVRSRGKALRRGFSSSSSSKKKKKKKKKKNKKGERLNFSFFFLSWRARLWSRRGREKKSDQQTTRPPRETTLALLEYLGATLSLEVARAWTQT